MKNDDSFEKFMSGESLFGNSGGEKAGSTYSDNDYDRSDDYGDAGSFADEYNKTFGNENSVQNNSYQQSQYNSPQSKPEQSSIPQYVPAQNQGNTYTDLSGMIKEKMQSKNNPASIFERYPDGHVSTLKDGIPIGIVVSLVGIIFISLGLVFFLSGLNHAKEIKAFYENADQTAGFITNVKSETRRDSDDHHYNVYWLTFRYRYAETEFISQSETLSESDMRSIPGGGIEGTMLMIYVDKRHPGVIRVMDYSEDNAYYFVLFLAVFGLIIVFAAINTAVQCAKGKLWVVKRRGTLYTMKIPGK